MNADDAARRLAGQINAPKGSVSVAALYREVVPIILVWYDPRHVAAVADLPSSYEGFNVVVEPRRVFVGA